MRQRRRDHRQARMGGVTEEGWKREEAGERPQREGLAGLGALGQGGLMEMGGLRVARAHTMMAITLGDPLTPGPITQLLSCSPSAESGRKVILISNFL